MSKNLWQLYQTKIIIAAAAVVFAAAPLYILTVPTGRVAGEAVTVTVEEGQSLFQIADLLKREKIIRSSVLFVAWTVAAGDHRLLKAGEYTIPENSSLIGIERLLAGGLANSDDIVVTIPEGLNVWEIDRRLAGAGLIREGEFAQANFRDEGSFFPDTYRFSRHQKAALADIADKMKRREQRELENLSFPLDSRQANEILIVASMLEKEARRKEDMQIIAGIISRRMKLGMKLELDATVAYGYCLRKSLAINFDKDCLVHLAPVGSEIHVDSSYNTYRHEGLPPAPIANPGSNAIAAALHPADTAYLYYLSVPDGSRIIYSKTSREHEANRRKYLGI